MEHNGEQAGPGPERVEHEEAILPVKPGFRTSSEASGPRRSGPGTPVLAWSAGAVLFLAAAVVIFVLPGWVERRAEQAPAAAAEPAAEQRAEPARPVLTPAEIAELTDRADTLLADLLSQQQRLAGLSAESWGGKDFERYGASARAGDDAYLSDAYEDAIAHYSDALELGEALLARSAEIVQRALAAGVAALEAGNAALAIEQLDLVLSIDEGNEAARAARARAERLPEVLASLRQADAAREQGRLAEAAEAYRAALAIDAAFAPAAKALAAVERQIADERFETLMSNGFRALTEERYEAALAEFEDALAMRPDAAGARDGITQAEQGLHLDQIALAEARALAFERRELWQQAIAQYEAALETDDTLEFAKTGLERARSRADLDAKLENLIGNPHLLFADGVLDAARTLVDEAKAAAAASAGAGTGTGAAGAAAAETGGTSRLGQQIARLDELIALASTPVRVELRSDGATQVTLYRVGDLGVFAARAVELRPGNYTAVGSRDGYRDVRKSFTVLPGRELEPISVICMEPI